MLDNTSKTSIRFLSLPLIIVVLCWLSIWAAVYFFIPHSAASQLVNRSISDRSYEWFDEVSELNLIQPEYYVEGNYIAPAKSQILKNLSSVGEIASVGLYNNRGKLLWSASEGQINAMEQIESGAFTISEKSDKISRAVTQILRGENIGVPEKFNDQYFAQAWIPDNRGGHTIGQIILTYNVTSSYSWYLRIIQLVITFIGFTTFALLLTALFIKYYRKKSEYRALEKARLHKQEIERFNQARENQNQTIREFAEWLQTCKSMPELFDVIKTSMSQIYPQFEGELYSLNTNKEFFKLAVFWGKEDAPKSTTLASDGCWALRKGRRYEYGKSKIGIRCAHVDDNSGPYECYPLIANGEAIGLISLSQREKQVNDLEIQETAFLESCLEQISLALSNILLHDQLEQQSLRDPLTGLYNRRGLQREMSAANDNYNTYFFSILDLDHFKKFNDTYGHDAGDAVLCAVSSHIKDRADGLAFRMGGEELAIILPQIDELEARNKLDEICIEISKLEIGKGEINLPNVTASFGVSQQTNGNESPASLIKAADLALYEAKKKGRNRVVWNKDLRQKESPKKSMETLNGQSKQEKTNVETKESTNLT